MKYGRVAENDRINDSIYKCFNIIGDEIAKEFVRKFADQPHEEDQVLHTFRELILGTYLVSKGYDVASEHVIGLKTPDWSILKDDELECIVELINFHPRTAVADDIKAKHTAGDIWIGWIGSSTDRLWSALQDKAVVYKLIAESNSLAYVISLYPDFSNPLRVEELEGCLYDAESGLFRSYPHVSGVLFFSDSSAVYSFRYYPNDHAVQPFCLPDGRIDFRSFD